MMVMGINYHQSLSCILRSINSGLILKYSDEVDLTNKPDDRQCVCPIMGLWSLVLFLPSGQQGDLQYFLYLALVLQVLYSTVALVLQVLYSTVVGITADNDLIMRLTLTILRWDRGRVSQTGSVQYLQVSHSVIQVDNLQVS